MTPKQAQIAEEIKLNQLGKPRPKVAAVDESIETVLGRIKAIPDAEAIKAAEDERARRHQNLVDNLRQHWAAPARHVARTSLDMSGEWGARLAKIQSTIGSGKTWAICGTRGNGKTQMAVEAMRHCTQMGIPARYVAATEFFAAIKATYRKDWSETEMNVIERYRRPRLLVIDEIGKRGDTDWENNLLFHLLDKRYQDMTDTIVLANLTAEEMAKSLGPSLSDRMSETGGLIECTWASRR